MKFNDAMPQMEVDPETYVSSEIPAIALEFLLAFRCKPANGYTGPIGR